MEIWGYAASILVGLFLGLIGGGGSILIVPILVYLFGVAPVSATGYSLFVVGVTSAVGAWHYGRMKLIDFRTGIIFAVPAFAGVFLTRMYIVPALPDPVLTNGAFRVSKDAFIMIFFALVMLAASLSMIRGRRDNEHPQRERRLNLPVIGAEGLVVGGVTGFVGAGGGFLIIPALVVLSQLPMKMAVGTSLLIIAVKSVFGFLGELSAADHIDWQLLLTVTALSVAGLFVGTRLVRMIPGSKLKTAFGYFVFVMGVYILGKQFL